MQQPVKPQAALSNYAVSYTHIIYFVPGKTSAVSEMSYFALSISLKVSCFLTMTVQAEFTRQDKVNQSLLVSTSSS